MPHAQTRFLMVVTAVAMVLWGSVRSSTFGADTFRDPLNSKAVSGKGTRGSGQGALLKVSLTPQKSGDEFVLSVGLKLPEGSYTYSTNREFSGATRFMLAKTTTGIEPVQDEFSADHEPKHDVDELGQSLEKFTDGGVTWSRRFRLLPGTKPDEARIVARVKYQICNASSCTPHDETFDVGIGVPARVVLTANARELMANKLPAVSPTNKLETTTKTAAGDGSPKPEAGPQPFEIEITPQRGKSPDPVKVRFWLTPENGKVGDAVTLSITMRLEPGWHTFALDQDPLNYGNPTIIDLSSTKGLKPTEETFSPTLVPEIERIDEGKEQRIHHKEITWTRQFTVEKAEYGVAGELAYQICNMGSCRPTKKVPFVLGYGVPPLPEPQVDSQVVTKVEPKEDPKKEPKEEEDDPEGIAAVPLDKLLPSFQGEIFHIEDDTAGGLGQFLLYAFLGGLILNVMPCVLPVIAIKIFSFLKQAGESRARILALNVVYSAGVVSVFLVLASLAVFAKFGWGGLFQETGFQVAMTCVVFAMGLSLLGVFEIPVPGLVGSAASHQSQEGLMGAFLTGVFATLLATPCSGPFLGVTLGWSVKQPAHITYLVWTVMGLGMASPYLVLGFFPGWVKFLPKPGNWMVTFKEVCGFLMMATVIFLMSSLKATWIFPMLILLLSIGFALWMVGHLYNINSPDGRRWFVRSLASAVCLGGWWLALGLADEHPSGPQLPWKPFKGDVVDAELKSGRTVLIDFTAQWCATCKTVKKFALNTDETLAIVKQHDVVTLKADWTDGSPEVTRWLNSFGSSSIPVLLIFPGNDPTHPIMLRDVYTKRTLLQKLEHAVESKPGTTHAVTQR